MSSFFIHLKTSAFRQFINEVELQREFMCFFSLISKPVSPRKRRIQANGLKDTSHTKPTTSMILPLLSHITYRAVLQLLVTTFEAFPERKPHHIPSCTSGSSPFQKHTTALCASKSLIIMFLHPECFFLTLYS